MILSTISNVLVTLVALWVLVDLIVAFIQLFFYADGPGGCIEDPTVFGFFTYWRFNGPESCNPEINIDKCNTHLGKWKRYASYNSKKEKNNFLCEKDIDKLINDDRKDNYIPGYSTMELSGWVASFVLIIALFWSGIVTRNETMKAEITFWILIITVIITSIKAISYESGGIIIPDQESPLNYITDKLGLEDSDQLQYSFSSMKADGGECFIEGTFLGGGTHPKGQPPIYSGDCTDSDVPLY
jgi:hypothetical protein